MSDLIDGKMKPLPKDRAHRDELALVWWPWVRLGVTISASVLVLRLLPWSLS